MNNSNKNTKKVSGDNVIETIQTANAPAAIGPYSQAKVVGELVFTSGQIPLHPISGQVTGDDITEQTKQALNNLSEVLKAAGSSMNKVIKTTCFLVNMSDFTEFNQVYETYFPNKPSRTCVAVKELPKAVLVEVEAVALKG